MSPELCKGARAANYRQDRESIGHVHRAPQAAKRRLWAEQSSPALIKRKRDKGLVDRGKGTNPREGSKKGTAEAARLMTGVE